LEALVIGSFHLRDNVTYAIGRVKESPAKFIRRQRDRIDGLVEHHRARDSLNALRLIVATSLLKEIDGAEGRNRRRLAAYDFSRSAPRN